jgi:hypothetical protein
MMKMALFPAVLAGFFLTFSASADAIDGNWCTKSGRQLSIEGSKTKAPSGKRMTGNYDCHEFDYVTPKGESDSGQNAVMVMHDDETMQMTIGKGKPHLWKGCAALISKFFFREN